MTKNLKNGLIGWLPTILMILVTIASSFFHFPESFWMYCLIVVFSIGNIFWMNKWIK